MAKGTPLNLVDIRIVIIDEPTFSTFRREFVTRYPTCIDLSTKLAPKNTFSNVSMDLNLPFVRPAHIGSILTDAKQKEPEERMILEALKEE